MPGTKGNISCLLILLFVGLKLLCAQKCYLDKFLDEDKRYFESANVTKPPCKPDANGDLIFVGNIEPLKDEHSRHFIFDMDKCSIRRPTPADYRKCFTDKTIVLMGDSTTNFQYFSLASYIRYGSIWERNWLYPGNWDDFYRAFEEELTVPLCSKFDSDSVHNDHVHMNYTLYPENANLIVRQIIDRDHESIINTSKATLQWAIEVAKADIAILNFGHWWYAYHLGNAFSHFKEGEYGQMIVRAYEAVFFYGQELKRKYPHIKLVFKPTTANKPGEGNKAHDQLEPLLHPLAKYYGWDIFDVRSLLQRGNDLGVSMFLGDPFHFSSTTNSMVNDFMYNFLC